LTRKVQGQKNSWQLSDKPVGSGDAGEVYAVTCLEQPDLTGVMKTPARIATLGTIQRQAAQIAQERQALVRLDGLPDGKVHPPRMLDESQAFTTGTANYFIISETAQGESLASMLSQSRQTGQPFPYRVIITVLDALFDLFSRAHRVGVLWNDVKLEHIYWHDPTGEIAVIDWGNAIFLDEEINNGQRTPPRWQDYRQFVDTLGGFLQNSAPDLYDDLGWEEFQGEELNSTRVSVLARRIAYQQQVLELKEMEYKSLIMVLLRKKPTLENLQKIQDHIESLDKIGASWPQEKLLIYGQNLIDAAAEDGETDAIVKASDLIWEILRESLNLSWHLVKEYCRHPEVLSHPLLTDLWTLTLIARESEQKGWWQHLVPVLRQKAMGTVLPEPIQVTQSLLTWAKTQEFHENDPVPALTADLETWSIKGSSLEESPFDYAALTTLSGEFNLPKRIHSDTRRVFNAGKESIQHIVKGWEHMDWDIMPLAFRALLCWDPERWGLLALFENILAFQDWLKHLYAGPKPGEDVPVFIQSILKTRPPIELVLGRPNWFIRMDRLLVALLDGSAISEISKEAKNCCPWVLQLEAGKVVNSQPGDSDDPKDKQDN